LKLLNQAREAINKLETTPSYLFVYGTLRSNFDIQAKKDISDCLELIGNAEISGKLYDMGGYPAALPVGDDEKSHIRGEVFKINDSEKVFAALDVYEGSCYKRQQVNVHLPDGQNVDAWIYWYIASVDGKPRIKYKDYVEYLKNKNSFY